LKPPRARYIAWRRRRAYAERADGLLKTTTSSRGEDWPFFQTSKWGKRSILLVVFYPLSLLCQCAKKWGGGGTHARMRTKMPTKGAKRRRRERGRGGRGRMTEQCGTDGSGGKPAAGQQVKYGRKGRISRAENAQSAAIVPSSLSSPLRH
jgi:hypothetical protein